jgi:cytochrome P450
MHLLPSKFHASLSQLRQSLTYYSTSAYFPFSAGHHSCIGMNFAWQEMRVVAANYLARFDVEEVPKQKLDIRQYITMQFADGNWKAMLKPRKPMKV